MPKKKYKFDKIAEIIWRDAEEHGEAGWNDLDEILKLSENPCPVIKSVGYIIHESSDHISIVSSLGPDICGTVEKIPKSFITSIEILERISENILKEKSE